MHAQMQAGRIRATAIQIKMNAFSGSRRLMTAVVKNFNEACLFSHFPIPGELGHSLSLSVSDVSHLQGDAADAILVTMTTGR